MKAIVLLSAQIAILGVGHAQILPMPPHFTGEQAQEAPLEEYPLGVITKQAAFVHHGKADHSITLPNGLEGWVYQVRLDREVKSYRQPAGSIKRVVETEEGPNLRTYTLMFDTRGIVIDVLYNENGSHDGLSAVQIQRQADPAGQLLPSVRHGPHFPPGTGGVDE